MTEPSQHSDQDRPVDSFDIVRFDGGKVRHVPDAVAVEQPLEIRVVYGLPTARKSKSLSITMRTPGNDPELAAGFLFSENVIQHRHQIAGITYVGPAPQEHSSGHGNTLSVELTPDVRFSPSQLQRHFYMTSSCGVCGKASIEAVMAQGFRRLEVCSSVSAETIVGLPNRLRSGQPGFDRTGGLHAAGWFDLDGEMISLKEDVGRHNAVDKLVGGQLLQDSATSGPMGGILVVSGRASFELVQKALAASFEILVAVGAPSSLAIELAAEFNLTLIGFASADRFNVYSGFQRIRFQSTKES